MALENARFKQNSIPFLTKEMKFFPSHKEISEELKEIKSTVLEVNNKLIHGNNKQMAEQILKLLYNKEWEKFLAKIDQDVTPIFKYASPQIQP